MYCVINRCYYSRKEVGEEPEKELFSKNKAMSEGVPNVGKRFTKKKPVGETRGRGREEMGGRGRGSEAGRGRGGRGSEAGRGRRGGGRGGRGGGGRDDSAGFRDKKAKRPTKVYNSEGVGPDYRKGSSKGGSRLKGVRGGKIQKGKKRR